MTDLRIAALPEDAPTEDLAVALLEATVACPESAHEPIPPGKVGITDRGLNCTTCNGTGRVYWLDRYGTAGLRVRSYSGGWNHPRDVGAWMEAALAMTNYKPPACSFVSVRQGAYQVEMKNVLAGVAGTGLGPTVYDALIRAFYAAATPPPERLSGLGKAKE